MSVIIKEYKNYNADEILSLYKDAASILYIQDIIVLKSYHRKGIGTKLIQNMLERFSHIYQKVLLTDNQERTIKFYQSLGFKMDCEIGCVAFVKVCL